ncbi:MAG: hypothetical protein ACT4N4_08220 [Rhodospirillales bacterium]
MDRLLATIRRVRWFARLGEPLSAAQRRDAASWLAGLGYPGCALAEAGDWRRARRIASDPRWERGWWQAEEKLRLALLRKAERRAGARRAMELLTEVTMAAQDGAAKAAARKIPDPGLAAAAAGAATQACYQGALAYLAGAGADHAFSAKLGLFLGGRWPLGILGRRAYIF